MNSAEELKRSQLRWRGDEPDQSLTWGVKMSGAPFVDWMTQRCRLTEASTLLEVGPGYGRLTDALLAANTPFGHYLGLELSAHRVTRLTAKYVADRRFSFVVADILGILPPRAAYRADVVFSSATFHHLYPDCSGALERLGELTASDADLFLDFTYRDAAASDAYFESKHGTYIRIYSAEELAALFDRSPFLLRERAAISFGPDAHGHEVRRTILHATRRA